MIHWLTIIFPTPSNPSSNPGHQQDIADVYLIESELRSNMDALFGEVEDIDTLWVPWRSNGVGYDLTGLTKLFGT
jgi:hypothetical protein